jgi:CcmD family protein
MSYLYAAYAATWIIHMVYLGSILMGYRRLQREIEDMAKKK